MMSLRKVQRRRVVLALCLLILSLVFQTPTEAEGPIWITMNQRISVPAGMTKTYLFTATSNNLFRIQSFGKAHAKASLYTGERLLYEADGFSMEARLTRGETYLLTVAADMGAGDAEIEIMRVAFGRYYDRPIQFMIEDSPYRKTIAKPYDTHWYEFVPKNDGPHLIYARADMDIAGYLLDENGDMMEYGEGVRPEFGGGFYIRMALKKGKPYYVRVGAKDDATGNYSLYVRPETGVPAEGIALSKPNIELVQGDSAFIEYQLIPAGSSADVLFVSSDPEALYVTEDGKMTAIAQGSAEVAVIAGQDIYAAVQVEVSAVKVSRISFQGGAFAIRAGQSRALSYEIRPANPSNPRIVFSSSNPEIADVDAFGTVTGIAPGEVVITAASEDGGAAAELTVYVSEAAAEYRALVIGERQYADGRTRLGAVNTTQGVYDMLSNLSFDGQKYEITMRMDVSRGFAISQIRSAFRNAKETDVSLLYINCHGGVSNGEAYIEFSDLSRLTPAQLERELRAIPGTVVVLIDCCNSGAFISGDADTFNRRVVQAFDRGGATPLLKSKYLVMTSAAYDQDSHRVRYNNSENEDMNATAFSVALCEAGGWDLIKDRKVALKAEVQKKSPVTFNDAYNYIRRRVVQLLSNKNEQDVQVYPQGANFALFSRD